MPPLKQCSLKFIHDILYERKKRLNQKDVPNRKIPNWPELGVKNCWNMITENCPEVLEYLPDPHGKNEVLPPREYFWQVVYALRP